jgi:predicted RNA binding protein YcfA (HicA-like mRNA interferase family)
MKVRDVIKLVEAGGWHQVAMKDDHRQYKHPKSEGVSRLLDMLVKKFRQVL